MSHPAADLVEIADADVRIVDGVWPFAESHAEDIARHWRMRTQQQPKLFDGETFVIREWSLAGGQFTAQCLRTRYKNALYWREHKWPDSSVKEFFAAGIMHTREGWLVLGRAGPNNSNKGRLYPPLGTLDANDIRAGRIDLEGNIVREIKEETGLSIARDVLGPALLILDGPRIAYIRPIQLRVSGVEVTKAIYRFFERQKEPELAEIVLVKSAGEIDRDTMPPFTIRYIEHVFQHLDAC